MKDDDRKVWRGVAEAVINGMAAADLEHQICNTELVDWAVDIADGMLERYRDRYPADPEPAPSGWTTDRPTEPGWYWFRNTDHVVWCSHFSDAHLRIEWPAVTHWHRTTPPPFPEDES